MEKTLNGLTNEEFTKFKQSTSLAISDSKEIEYFKLKIDEINENKSEFVNKDTEGTFYLLYDDIIQNTFQYTNLIPIK